MKRTRCPICKGSGKTKRALSFINPKKVIEQTCHACRGKGKLPHTVDLFDILEYLRGVGTGSFSSVADVLERKFGPGGSG